MQPKTHASTPTMTTAIVTIALAVLMAAALPTASANPYELLTGVNAGQYPGSAETVFPIPGPGIPGMFFDGDRLAGTADDGPPATWLGAGTPLFATNQFGSLSFLYRRASVPIPGLGQLPLMGIDYIGGPRLDLDGDLDNGQRSLVPVLEADPVEIPDSFSLIDLSFDALSDAVIVNGFDATATNEGGPGLDVGFAVTLITIAGTDNAGGQTGTIPNPDFDTRSGTLTPHGEPGVYRIDDLPVELWYDAISPNSSSADVLGTLQNMSIFRGWLILRDCQTGQFPTLADKGLGGTLWPAIDSSFVGQTFQTANGLFGGSATISDGNAGDVYSFHPNGQALAGGDLGAYLDAVVVPLIDPGVNQFVYLESAAFGLNNSGDPVFGDTNGYDAVIIAQKRIVPGDIDDDGDIDADDRALFVEILLDPASHGFDLRDNADINRDCRANAADIAGFIAAVL